MSILEAIILGIVQGLTEFIPVSSSGHLVLVHKLFGQNIAGDLAFDVALHFGTLLSLLVYFRSEVWRLAGGLLGRNDSTKLAWLVALATVPAVVVGFLLADTIEEHTRSVFFVAGSFLCIGLYMLYAEKRQQHQQRPKKLLSLNAKQAVIIGLAQAVALLPGVSRSGATITTGLYFGFSRVAATKFSFLMAIPIITGAVIKVFVSEGVSGLGGDITTVVIGIGTAFVSGLLAITFLLRYLAKNTLRPFAYYLVGMSFNAVLIGLAT